MASQKFCLKWDGFQGSVTSVFDQLRAGGELLDVTLCCEGQRVRAHRMMLSACSPYFRDLLKNTPCQQMAIFLKDTSATDLNAIVEFMYKGCVNVAQTQLASFIKTAETLQIRGLSGEDDNKPPDPAPAAPAAAPRRALSPPLKRRRRLSVEESVDAPLSCGPAASPSRRPETPVLLSGSSSQSAPSPAPVPVPVPVPVPAGSPSPAGERTAAGQGDQPPPAMAAAGPLAPPAPSASLLQERSEPDGIKVEKLDLSDVGEEDGGSSLDAALGQLAEYEGGYGPAATHGVSFPNQPYGGPPPPQPPLAGPSAGAGVLPHQSPVMDDGSSPGHVCDTCGRRYKHRDSLVAHSKVHAGVTTCHVCGSVSSNVQNLRQHLETVHRMAREHVRSLTRVPTAYRSRPPADLPRRGPL